MCSRSNWDLELLAFKERGKPEYPEKNLSEQGREPTTTQPTCGVVVISSEDVCWNIRNVKLKFFLSRNAFIFPYVYHRSLLFVCS